MPNIFKMPMHLQFFAEPDGTDAAGAQTGEEPKNFTQEDIDAAVEARVAREAKKASKAQKDLQAQLDAATAQLNNAGKSKEEQENADLEALKGNLTAKEEELANTKAELEALKQGVDAEKLDKVIKLAKLSDEDDIEEAIKGVLDEFPMFKKEEKKGGPTFSKDGNHNGQVSTITKQEIMQEKDAIKRQKLIAENPRLFKK